MATPRKPGSTRRFHKETIEHMLERKSIRIPWSGCQIWMGCVSSKGYGWVGIFKTNKRMTVHRLSWILKNGSIPDGMHVLHKCDVPSCINPDHLFLGTNNDNVADRVRKGRSGSPKGENCHKARLTTEQVIAIRADTRRNYEIALSYGVDQCTISHVKLRRSWKHI